MAITLLSTKLRFCFLQQTLQTPPLKPIDINIAETLEKSVTFPAEHQMGQNRRRRSTVSEQSHTAHVTPGIRVRSRSWDRR